MKYMLLILSDGSARGGFICSMDLGMVNFEIRLFSLWKEDSTFVWYETPNDGSF